MWEYRGQKRPYFAIEPEPGQESVWDYPRPPALKRDGRRVEIRFADVILADSRRTQRVLETASPPTFYIPPEDVHVELLTPLAGASFCEWKGTASYYDVRAGEKVARDAAWTYRSPTEAFITIRNWVAFYPGRMDECTVDGEVVRAQAGGFYGGWITSELEGPFKGEPGTQGW